MASIIAKRNEIYVRDTGRLVCPECGQHEEGFTYVIVGSDYYHVNWSELEDNGPGNPPGDLVIQARSIDVDQTDSYLKCYGCDAELDLPDHTRVDL